MKIAHLSWTRMALAMTAAALLGGCASFNATPTLDDYQQRFSKEPPTTQWLRENVPNFKDKSWIEPTKDNIAVYEFMAQELAKRESAEEKANQWMKQTHRQLTQDWANTGRGGAALRQPAYIHVLGDGEIRANAGVNTPMGNLVNPNEMIASSLAKLNDIKKGKGYSVYELGRWERYCNHGQGMDKRDWAFVKKEGPQNVPLSLVGKCSPPKKIK